MLNQHLKSKFKFKIGSGGTQFQPAANCYGSKLLELRKTLQSFNIGVGSGKSLP